MRVRPRGIQGNVRPERIRKVGTAPMPDVKRVPYGLLLTGRYDCDWVEIEGVIQRAWVPAGSTNGTL